MIDEQLVRDFSREAMDKMLNRAKQDPVWFIKEVLGQKMSPEVQRFFERKMDEAAGVGEQVPHEPPPKVVLKQNVLVGALQDGALQDKAEQLRVALPGIELERVGKKSKEHRAELFRRRLSYHFRDDIVDKRVGAWSIVKGKDKRWMILHRGEHVLSLTRIPDEIDRHMTANIKESLSRKGMLKDNELKRREEFLTHVREVFASLVKDQDEDGWSLGRRVSDWMLYYLGYPILRLDKVPKLATPFMLKKIRSELNRRGQIWTPRCGSWEAENFRCRVASFFRGKVVHKDDTSAWGIVGDEDLGWTLMYCGLQVAHFDSIPDALTSAAAENIEWTLSSKGFIKDKDKAKAKPQIQKGWGNGGAIVPEEYAETFREAMKMPDFFFKKQERTPDAREGTSRAEPAADTMHPYDAMLLRLEAAGFKKGKDEEVVRLLIVDESAGVNDEVLGWTENSVNDEVLGWNENSNRASSIAADRRFHADVVDPRLRSQEEVKEAAATVMRGAETHPTDVLFSEVKKLGPERSWLFHFEGDRLTISADGTELCIVATEHIVPESIEGILNSVRHCMAVIRPPSRLDWAESVSRARKPQASVGWDPYDV